VVDKEASGIRTLYLNNMPHSAMYLNGSEESVYQYTDYFKLGFGYNPDVKDVLFIGGGGFSGPKHFLERYPWVNIDVVEIDPDVIEIAYEYFRVPREETRLNVYNVDGRSFLEDARSYDVIVLDAYSDTYVPFHLMTLEFHQNLKRHLNPAGVVTSNLISSLVGDTSELLWCEVETVKKLYPQIDLYTTRYPSAGLVQNIIMIACSETITLEEVHDNIESVVKNPDKVQGYLEMKYEANSSANSFVLRDNYAPVESLLNPVTLTSYEREGRLKQTSVLNPYILTGIWLISLGSIYLVIQRWSKEV
jgi:spermidine synthase